MSEAVVFVSSQSSGPDLYCRNTNTSIYAEVCSPNFVLDVKKKVIGFFDFSREKFGLTQSFICGIPSGQSGIPNTSLLISPRHFCLLPPGMQVSLCPSRGPIPTSINEWVFGVKKTYTYQKRFEVTLNVGKVNSEGGKVNKYFVVVTDKAFFFVDKVAFLERV